MWMDRVLSLIALLATLGLAGWVMQCADLISIFPTSGRLELDRWECTVLVTSAVRYCVAGVR